LDGFCLWWGELRGWIFGLKPGVGVTKTRESVKKIEKSCEKLQKLAKEGGFLSEKERKRARTRRNWNHEYPFGRHKFARIDTNYKKI